MSKAAAPAKKWFNSTSAEKKGLIRKKFSMASCPWRPPKPSNKISFLLKFLPISLNKIMTKNCTNINKKSDKLTSLEAVRFYSPHIFDEEYQFPVRRILIKQIQKTKQHNFAQLDHTIMKKLPRPFVFTLTLQVSST